MKKIQSQEWNIISSSRFSSKENLLSYKDYPKRNNHLYISKDYTNEPLTNEWKIIMNSSYPCKTYYITENKEQEDILEF